ncbi:MAG: arylformamidase [Alphaproteobacteria bacterium]|nr:arylformamidase [Alphaproteobacteria bacterium]
MTVWDLSPPIRPGIPVWPGDTPYDEARTWHLDETCPVNVARITMSTHTGSHADAPLHYDPAGAPIGGVSLAPYIGPCRLIDATEAEGVVPPEMVRPFLDPPIERMLLRTMRHSVADRWDENFTAVAPETIELIAESGGLLVGIDSPSIDPQNSKSLDAHNMVRRHRMAILEGLVLADIPTGDYELIALPLKLANADAAPVRAILRGLR